MKNSVVHKKTISLGSLEGIVEEIGGIRKFRVLYENNQIPSYQRIILEERLCEGLLKMYFLELDGLEWIYYDFSGYIQLPDIFQLWAKQEKCIAQKTLTILSRIVRYILSSENYLLSSEGFSLNPDTVFINPLNEEVRLAYVPGIPHPSTVQDCILELIASTEILSDDDQWEIYGEEIRQEILLRNYGLTEIFNYLNEKSKELYLHQWPDKNLLREMTFEEEQVKNQERKNQKLKIHWPFKFLKI